MSISAGLPARHPGSFALLSAAAVCAAALVLMTSCGGTASSAGTGGTVQNPTVVIGNTAPPATETVTTEAPQSPINGAAIRVASLPIGGDVGGETALRCGHVSWLGPTPLPRDVVVALRSVSVQPAGIFGIGGGGCAGGSTGPMCSTSWAWTWKTSTTQCLIPLTQVVEGDPGQEITLVLSGTVRCAQRSSCAAFTELGGSQIRFSPLPGVVTTGPAGSAPPSSVTSPPSAPPSGAGESS